MANIFRRRGGDYSILGGKKFKISSDKFKFPTSGYKTLNKKSLDKVFGKGETYSVLDMPSGDVLSDSEIARVEPEQVPEQKKAIKAQTEPKKVKGRVWVQAKPVNVRNRVKPQTPSLQVKNRVRAQSQPVQVKNRVNEQALPLQVKSRVRAQTEPRLAAVRPWVSYKPQIQAKKVEKPQKPKKDKYVRAYIDFRMRSQEKLNHIVDKEMVPITTKLKKLGAREDSMTVKANDFARKLSSARSKEVVDKLSREVSSWKNADKEYSKVKKTIESTKLVGKRVKEANDAIGIEDKKNKLIEKLNGKVERLNGDLKNKKNNKVEITKRIALLESIVKRLTEGGDKAMTPEEQEKFNNDVFADKNELEKLQKIEAERQAKVEEFRYLNNINLQDESLDQVTEFKEARNLIRAFEYVERFEDEANEKKVKIESSKNVANNFAHKNSEPKEKELPKEEGLDDVIDTLFNNVRDENVTKKEDERVDELMADIFPEYSQGKNILNARSDEVLSDAFELPEKNEAHQQEEIKVHSEIPKHTWEEKGKEKVKQNEEPEEKLKEENKANEEVVRTVSNSQTPKNISAPFGAEWKRVSVKKGGANDAGHWGGVYETISLGSNIRTTALFKRDTKKGKVRVAKLIGEGLAGSLLNKFYERTMGDEYLNRVAQTKLVQVQGMESDKSGNSTYLKSVYIDSYQADFWYYAYKEKATNHYLGIFATLSTPESILEYKNKINEFKKTKEDVLTAEMHSLAEIKKQLEFELNMDGNKDEIRTQIDNINARLDKLSIEKNKLNFSYTKANQVLLQVENEVKIRVTDAEKAGKKVDKDEISGVKTDALISFLVESDMDSMKRPSGVTNFASRKVVSDAILRDENNSGGKTFLRDFCEMAAPRLLMADFGLNSGNFGVAKVNGTDRLVALDFGAAFSKLNPEVNPYSRTKTGLQLTKFYKNHFLEYDDKIIKSKEMAQAFIKVGMVSAKEIDLWVNEGIKSELGEKFDKRALLKFAQRLGMDADKKEFSNKSEEEILSDIKAYMQVRLESRAKSLLHQGYALLLEHSYDKDHQRVNTVFLEKALKEHPGLAEFAINKFKKRDLLLHTRSQHEKVKDAVILAVNNAANKLNEKQEDNASVLALMRLLKVEEELMHAYAKSPSTSVLGNLDHIHDELIDNFLFYTDVDKPMIPLVHIQALKEKILKNEEIFKEQHIAVRLRGDEVIKVKSTEKLVQPTVKSSAEPIRQQQVKEPEVKRRSKSTLLVRPFSVFKPGVKPKANTWLKPEDPKKRNGCN